MECTEALSRQVSESESSLEMDDKRHFNDIATGKVICMVSSPAPSPTRRSISPSPALFQSTGTGVSAFVQPIPFHSTSHHRHVSHLLDQKRPNYRLDCISDWTGFPLYIILLTLDTGTYCGQD